MAEKPKPEHQNPRRFSTRHIILLMVFLGVLIMVVGGVVAYQLSSQPDPTPPVLELTVTTDPLDDGSCSLPSTPTPSSGVGIGDFGLQVTPDVSSPTQESCDLDP